MDSTARFRLRALTVLGVVAAAVVLPIVWGRGHLTSRDAVRAPGSSPVGGRSFATEAGVVEVWYPATPGAAEARVRYGQTYLGWVARNAVAAQPASPRPLVALSHGYSADRFELAWLAERLAAEGAVVIAVDHHDGGAPMDGELACKRARQLSKAIDAALGDPTIRSRIDPARVTVVGHSFGGTTALALGGARVRGKDGCADPRVTRVAATAPPTDVLDQPEAPSQLTAPLALWAGADDGLAAASDGLAARWKGAKLTRIPGAGHFVFKGVCTPYATLRMPFSCKDAPSVDRRAVHDAIAKELLAP